MLMNEMVKATGRLSIEIFSSSGLLKEKINVPNLVVTTGRNYIVSRMNTTAPVAVMSHMAVGTGTTEPVLADIALESQLGSRVALDSQTINANVITYIATFGAGVATGALTEAGIFNASTSGTMLCRTTFGVVTKAVDDIMVITWNVTVS
jgi:hypothetical protein